MYGWHGKLLRINLTTGTWRVEDIPEPWLRQYIGGRGVADRYLWEELDPKVDPVSPANKLIFATGPLTGTPAPCGARYMVVTKGYLTGAITTSNSGGHWGPALRFAGYDLLLLEGRAPQPVYVFIDDDHVEIRDAQAFWGKTVSETEDGIRNELGLPNVRIACIGPAGERLVRFACIMNDKHRAAGRSGVGAVMGSKNLKAIAVRGTRGIRVADPHGFMRAVWKFRQHLAESPARQGMTELGTAATIDLTQAFGGLPTRNFQQGQFEYYENLNGNSIKEKRMVANKACFACTIACGRVTRLPGEAADKYLVNTHPRNWRYAGEGPEYEAAWALGADTGVGDLDAVIKANWLCNDLGMDPISMGATLAAAMELYERGVLNDSITGIPLRFGSAEALIRMVEATAYREGFGHELAEGAKRMSEKFGHPEVFMGVKGQEFPAYDPRGFQGMGVAYATCNRGACHLRAWTPGLESQPGIDPHTPHGKAEWVAEEQNRTTAHDNSGICLFTAIGAPLSDIAECIAAATGIAFTYDDFVRAGERTWNLERLWNLRAGFTDKDDTLPERLLKVPHTSGPSKGVVVHLDEMLPVYYRVRGWDEHGVPRPEKLLELGLAGL
ncbi:MAG: aldehyde ferredoxin oxidoreductase family protein [Gemmatales bacterium]|nr:aldehyde ferredoxin oxidoreductase family protein [Gemmatales bacterium]MDW7995133.1 aldehyde ferredoxin oxidoreductase family protein [Gemmatales bacterium]